jgi:hypothetical protein
MGKVHFHHAVVEPDVLTMGKGDLQRMLGKVNRHADLSVRGPAWILTENWLLEVQAIREAIA